MERFSTSPAMWCALGAVIALAAAPADAAYMMTPLSGGQNQRQLAWGQSFTLDIALTSNTTPADTHTSALFQVRFTQPGLVMTSATWAAPYVTGGPNDFSVPAVATLPVTLGPSTLAGGLYPPGLTDIEFGNALVGQTFSTGNIVSMSFTIPANFGYTGPIFISLNPDEMASGFSVVPTSAGQVFRLDVVVPTPGVASLAGIAGVMAMRRRRA
jgi:hypothetical protein